MGRWVQDLLWLHVIGFESLLFFLYDYLSYVVCYTLVLSCPCTLVICTRPLALALAVQHAQEYVLETGF